jgi:hypothetical protein
MNFIWAINGRHYLLIEARIPEIDKKERVRKRFFWRDIHRNDFKGLKDVASCTILFVQHVEHGKDREVRMLDMQKPTVFGREEIFGRLVYRAFFRSIGPEAP